MGSHGLMSTKWDIKPYLRNLLGVHKHMCLQLKAHTKTLIMNVFSRAHYRVYRRPHRELRRTCIYLPPSSPCSSHTNQTVMAESWEVIASSLRKKYGQLGPEKRESHRRIWLLSSSGSPKENAPRIHFGVQMKVRRGDQTPRRGQDLVKESFFIFLGHLIVTINHRILVSLVWKVIKLECPHR